MATILLQLEVKDYNTWRNSFNSYDDLRNENGQISHRVFTNLDNPNMVTILFEWDAVENWQHLFSSAEIREAMQKAGVIPPPNMRILQER